LPRQRQLRRKHAGWFESRLHLLETRKTGKQQTGGDQQHERKRHFADEQHGAKTIARSD
jgi:hypothetical protein